MKFFRVKYEALECYPGSSHWEKTSRVVVAENEERARYIASCRANGPLPNSSFKILSVEEVEPKEGLLQ